VYVRKTAINWTYALEKLIILGRSLSLFNYYENRVIFSDCAEYKICLLFIYATSFQTLPAQIIIYCVAVGMRAECS
jgi:hypothetical protein